MQRICLFAATGAYNLGDECIVLSEYCFLRQKFPNSHFHVFTYDARSTLLPNDGTVSYESYFPHAIYRHPFRNLWAFFKTVFTVARSDIVVIGGGGIFYDNELSGSFNRLVFQWKMRTWLARFFGKPVYFFGVGVEVKDINVWKLSSIFFGENTHISVRDTKSQTLLRKIGIESTEIHDPVFMLPVAPKSVPHGRKRIGISLRQGFLKGEENAIAMMLDFLIIEGYELIFLNQSFHADTIDMNDAEFVKQFMESRHIHSTTSIEETLAIYPTLSFVVGMRLHAGILATIHSVPFFMISYSKKTDEFARKLEWEYVLSARTFDFELFRSRFLTMVSHEESLFFALTEKCDTIKKDAVIRYSQFFHGLE